jgi:hypothetical protein
MLNTVIPCYQSSKTIAKQKKKNQLQLQTLLKKLWVIEDILLLLQPTKGILQYRL